MTTDPKEYAYWIALAHAEGLGNAAKNHILAKCFGASNPLSSFFLSDSSLWGSEYGLSQENILSLSEAKKRIPNYSFLAESIIGQGYAIITIFDNTYPKAIKANLKYNSPVLLYAKGNLSLLNSQCTAIVGSRNASPLSLQFTSAIARKAVNRGNVVVSGFAKGVDRMAFDAAVENNGNTIVVLPQGITTFGNGFRSMHRNMLNGRIVVISQFYPEAPWNVGFAMARNSMIYGFADSIYVAQSDDKGGTYAGVTEGLRHNRPIFVRKPEAGEKCANGLLISMGASAVDMNGDVVIEKESRPFHGEEDLVKAIRGYITGQSHTAKEIAEKVLGNGDRSSQARVRKLLDKIENVHKSTKSRVSYILGDLQMPSLF